MAVSFYILTSAVWESQLSTLHQQSIWSVFLISQKSTTPFYNEYFVTPLLLFRNKICYYTYPYWDFPGGSDGKESACSAGDWGSIPGSGRFPSEGNGYPLQYSCLGNPMDKGDWWAYNPWSPKESDMTETLTLFIVNNYRKSTQCPNCKRKRNRKFLIK